MLRNNQILALEKSINNNFESGIHYHATGTGKSIIGLELIKLYNKKYPKNNIMWICEKKSVLVEQFSSDCLKKKGYYNFIKSFNILNYTINKQKDWYNSINIGKYWNKPILIIINRAYLTSQIKYEKIKNNIDLIIHDECHSIINKSTQKFYNYILKKFDKIKCIGFTATPELEIKPFDKTISKYSIYDAVCDNIIVNPRIMWLTSNDIIHKDSLMEILKQEIDKMYYKKIIVWAGMIDYCYSLAKEWKTYFSDYLISIDTSIKDNNKEYSTFQEFEKCEEKGILFCASKHREGSDIKNLDTCIFMDYVENRNSRTFIQCAGRVLRKDKNNKKKYGLIIDLKAKSTLKVCERMIKYFNIPANVYPWKHEHINIKNNIVKHNLILVKNNYIPCNDNYNRIYNITEIKNKFIRKTSNDKVYIRRMNHEIELLINKKLICYLFQALDILKITKNIPHITRGSCGSSLICYLMGISHVDPIKYDIKFARFLNEYRDTLPDIDFDFPYNLRDDVFLQLEMKWPGKIARISNHVYYHEKSALREAIRRNGIRKFISKYDINKEINKLDKNTKISIKKTSKKLENTFRCFSLHCGGIVYYPNGIPKDLILGAKGNLQQICLNKKDISSEKIFKIDILSSRGLAQLSDCTNNTYINFEEEFNDKKTSILLSSGNNIGITLGESILIRKYFMKIKPKNIHDVALCLSIIRPAAKKARDFEKTEDKLIIYDDDAIDIIKDILECSDSYADKYRRLINKDYKKTMKELRIKLEKKGYRKEKIKGVLNKLNDLRKYSFCKSHAYSYAQLVWRLAYQKANYPINFWTSTLKHCQSSYKKWVHLYEARIFGVKQNNNKVSSIYSENRNNDFKNLNTEDQLRKYGYWDMKTDNFYPDCYYFINDNVHYFKGIIATSRILRGGKYIILFIGVEKGKYIELKISLDNVYLTNKIGVKGNGILNNNIIEVKKIESY